MASERQIAANRRNAQKSTGPQTYGGKKRIGKNAYRHGLAARMMSSFELDDKQVERLARRIAGNTNGVLTLACARAAAEAELDLARVRQTKAALIERVARLGQVPPEFCSEIPRSRLRCEFSKSIGSLKQISSPEPMPLLEPERSAEAVRRSLPELVKLDRYEHRASSRRDRAIRELTAVLRRERS